MASRTVITAKELLATDGCIAVRFEPWPGDSRQMFIWRPDACGAPLLLAYSQTALALALRGVLWHDEADHCPSWAGPRDVGACRCDVEASHG